MCANYTPVTRSDRLLAHFGVVRERDALPADAWPGSLAPFIRLAEDGSGRRILDDGQFGLTPHFKKELAAGRKMYNARSETVAAKPSYRLAWQRGQRCIIPAEFIYEPCYESASAVRWAIGLEGGVPMGIAGIYTVWREPVGGKEHFTFSMLTVNADGHSVMGRMHAPQDEKRMVVILDPAEYDAWLECPVAEAPRFFRRWEGPMAAHPAELARRAPRKVEAVPVQKPPPEPPPQGALF